MQDDVIGRCSRIMALIDAYQDKPTAMNRSSIRAALMDEFVPLLAAHNAGAQEPVAYLHEMHMEGDQVYERLTFDTTNAFGEPGRDYSESYAVTCTPLYAQTQPMTDWRHRLIGELDCPEDLSDEAIIERVEVLVQWRKDADQRKPMTNAARDVLAERRRHVEQEGWTTNNDDQHNDGEMALAAACYAESSVGYYFPGTRPETWPWSIKWWKPTTPRRDLIKAAALILAEIERLDRIAAIEREGEA